MGEHGTGSTVVTAGISPPQAPARCRDADIPPARELTFAQGRGWNCYACGKTLPISGGVLVGRAEGSSGVHDIGHEAYACP